MPYERAAVKRVAGVWRGCQPFAICRPLWRLAWVASGRRFLQRVLGRVLLGVVCVTGCATVVDDMLRRLQAAW